MVVEVRRKRIRRINLRVADDGRVHLSIPIWWATLAEGEAFLRSKWKWMLKVRSEILSSPRQEMPMDGGDGIARLKVLIGELSASWMERLGERDVTWKLRSMKSRWGSCNFRKRCITYSRTLACVPRELVEYVVVHELTHLKAHDHGAHFQALMDVRLPGWRLLRRRLNKIRFVPQGKDGHDQQ